MISAISSTCFHSQLEFKKAVILTLVECVAFSSIAAVLISLYGLTTYGYIGIGISGGLIALDLGLLAIKSCQKHPQVASNGSPRIHYLGGKKVPKDVPYNDGQQLQHDYKYEQLSLDIDGQEVHVYFKILEPYVKTWHQKYASEISFPDYISRLIQQHPSIKDKFLKWNVRYFHDLEREQTKVIWSAGKPQQIGLDAKSSDCRAVEPGTYIFALGKEHCYLAVKERPKVCHSSFLRGFPALSSGYITLNKMGEITEVVFRSGHYCPGVKEVQVFYTYLTNHLNPKQLSQISFYIQKTYDGEKIPWSPPK